MILPLTATPPLLEIATTILFPSEIQDRLHQYPTGGQVIRRAVGNQVGAPNTSTSEPEDLIPASNPSAIVKHLFLLAACSGINQQGGRRHLAIASALVRARRAMRPQSDRPRLRAVARPRTLCSPATVYLTAAANSAARRTPQTPIAFQAGRRGQQCTITPRLPFLGGSTVLLCPTQEQTRRSARVPDDRVRRGMGG